MQSRIVSVILAAALFAVPAAARDSETLAIDGRDYRVETLTAPQARAEVISYFNTGIKHLGMRNQIAECSLIIDLPVGTKDGNHSYGGVCKLHKLAKPDILVCYDKMLGRFAIAHPHYLLEHKASLAQFVAANCFGG